MTHGWKLRILSLSVALGGALVGCDGGSFDASGRFVPAPQGGRSAASSAVSAGAREGAAPAAAGAAQASPSYYAQPGSSAGAGAAAYGDSGSSYTAAASAASSGSSFDSFSRTPPAPVLQADGTPAKPAIARVSPESGVAQGGEEILITGSGFANVQVLFGNSPAQITSQSSNAVTVIAPDGPGGMPVSIVVTNRDGTYTVAGHAYRYLANHG